MSSAEIAVADPPATTGTEPVTKQNCKADESVWTGSEWKRFEPLCMYAVLKLTNVDGAGRFNPRASIRGVYPTESQAYAAAIHNLLYYLEEAEGDFLLKLRAIAKTSTLSLKDRLKSLVACQVSVRDRLEFVVKKTHLFNDEDLDVDSLLEGPIWPCVYWDCSTDEEDYNPDEDEDEDQSDDGDSDLERDEDCDDGAEEEEDEDVDGEDEEAAGMDEEETCIAKKKQRTE